MVQERIDIVINESGSRTVKRSLDSIGDTAINATRSLRLLQNGLFVLGGAGLLRGLQRTLDTLTNYENRIRFVTNSVAELNAVQAELFNISQRTRSSFESTATVYTRMALSAKQLGVSQREILQFTESLNKATILSGASTREASAALIQLSQGLSSNRLSGDELRSVLEQLPAVADIIAKSLGITRGELRKFGSEGKLSAQAVLKAFREAREEIDEKFAQTVPTIGQAFEYFYTGFLRVLDGLDDFTHGSELVARAIIAIADSLNVLVGAAIAAGSAFAAIKLGGYASALIKAVKLNSEMAAAIKAGNATLLTSVGIEQAKAASSLASARAQATATAAAVTDLAVRRQVLIKNAEIIATERYANEFIIKNGRARNALTGSFVSLSAATARQNALSRELLFTERSLRIATGELAAANTAAAASSNALAAAQVRADASNVAATGIVARLTASFPLLAGAIGLVTDGLGALGAAVLANPITAIIAVIIAAVAALVFFSDKIAVSADGVVNLRDVFIASWQLMLEALAPVGQFFADVFGPALKWIGDGFVWLWNKIVEGFFFVLDSIKKNINQQIGLFVGLVNSIIKAWNILPAALKDIIVIAFNGVLTVVETSVNGIIDAIKGIFRAIDDLGAKVGLQPIFGGLLDGFRADLSGFKGEVTGAAQEVGNIFNEEFSKALSTDYIGDAFGAIMDRARKIAEERLANLDSTGDGSPPPGGDGSGTSFADIVKRMSQENALLMLNRVERERLTKVLEVEKELKRSLTPDELALIETLIKENESLTAQAAILDELQQPLQDYMVGVDALDQLMKRQAITADQYTTQLRKLRIAYLDTQTDMASGFERGFLKVLEDASDFASQSEAIVKNAFEGMTDALAEFVMTGKLDFASLIQDINKQIIKLVISQAFTQLFGNGFGATGGGAGGGNLFQSLGNAFKSLFGFQNGGAFTVGSQTSVASIPGVDNRVVAFRAQDGETVSVTKKGQQAAGNTNYFAFNFPPGTDVESFKKSETQMAAMAARAISRGQRNL